MSVSYPFAITDLVDAVADVMAENPNTPFIADRDIAGGDSSYFWSVKIVPGFTLFIAVQRFGVDGAVTVSVDVRDDDDEPIVGRGSYSLVYPTPRSLYRIVEGALHSFGFSGRI